MISRQPAAKKTTISSTFNGPALSPFGANSSLANPIRPFSLRAQTIQHAKKTSAMASVRLTSALAPRKNGSVELKAFGRLMSPADRADAGNQAHPVRGENEDEDRGEEPERPPDQMRTDDAFEEAVEAFDEPLQEVLRAIRHLLHAPGRELREDDEAHGDDPGDEHGVGDREAERTRDLHGLLRQAMFLACRGRHRGAGSEDPRRHAARRHARRPSAHHVTGGLHRACQPAGATPRAGRGPAARSTSGPHDHDRQGHTRRSPRPAGRSRQVIDASIALILRAPW